MQQEAKHHNRLEYFRLRMGLTTSRVAHLLGHKDTSTYCDYERGDRLPSLTNAFRLGAIMRVQVEFLFGDTYDALRAEIRAEEERLPQSSPKL